MKWYQRELTIGPYSRGFHLITSEVIRHIPEIKSIDAGILQVFIKHTSASLTINENADPSVATDLESHFNTLAPEDMPYYVHTYEGPDDMPAHIKAAILGTTVHIPITKGRMNLGTWQGIFLCEHRDRATRRTLVLTLYGS
jgi:secondary thiamine-phosphate synthase enzyme